MKIKPVTDRDVLVLILLLIVTITLSAMEVIVKLTDPTRSFVDFAILFSFGWGMYRLGCKPQD